MVIDTDGSAFITKAEFDSLKNNFQAQIDNYNSSIDSKIDGAIAAYLAGISVSSIAYRTSLCNGVSNIKFKTNMDDYGWEQGDLGMDIFCVVGKMGTGSATSIITTSKLGWAEWRFSKSNPAKVKFGGIAASYGNSSDTAHWEGYCTCEEWLRGSFTKLNYGGGGWNWSPITTTTWVSDYYCYFSWQAANKDPAVDSYSWTNADPSVNEKNLFNFNSSYSGTTAVADRTTQAGWGFLPAGNTTVTSKGVRLTRENITRTDTEIVPKGNFTLKAVQTTDEVRDWNNITAADGKVKKPMINGLDYPEYNAGLLISPVTDISYASEGSYGWYKTIMWCSSWGNSYISATPVTNAPDIYFPCMGKRTSIYNSSQLWSTTYDSLVNDIKTLYGSGSILKCKSPRSNVYPKDSEHLALNAGLPIITLSSGETATIELPFADTKSKKIYFADGPFGLTASCEGAANLITNSTTNLKIETPLGGNKSLNTTDQNVTVKISCKSGQHMIFMRVDGDNNNVLTSFSGCQIEIVK